MPFECLSYQDFASMGELSPFVIVSESQVTLCTLISAQDFKITFSQIGDDIGSLREIDFDNVIDGMYVDSDTREVCLIAKVPSNMKFFHVSQDEYFYLDANMGKLSVDIAEKSDMSVQGVYCSVNQPCKMISYTKDGIKFETVVYIVDNMGVHKEKKTIALARKSNSCFIKIDKPAEPFTVILPSKNMK